MSSFKFKKLRLSSVFLGALFLALLIFIVQETKKEILKVEKTHLLGRIPASIPRSNDLSGLQGDSLIREGKVKLLSGLSLEQTKESASVHLGNFVMLNRAQQKDFACGVYNHVTVSFQAEGVAVDGEKPTLVVDSPCTVGDDISTLKPIQIPISQIKSQGPRNRELVVPQSQGSMHILTVVNSEAWPTKWALTDIKMSSDSDPTQSLYISPQEVRKNTNRPIFMKW